MNAQEISRQEYVSRINKVMNYIDAHLDQPIDLNVLANIALFSPYHFHRIFTVMMGETPNNYLLRIRLEKAAQIIVDNPSTSIGEAAYHCGFNSVSSFSRSFGKYFGMPAKKFRELEKTIYVKDGQRFSKNGKLISKKWQNQEPYDSQFCTVELNNLIFMDTKIEIKEMPEFNVAYIRHMGAFAEIGKVYERLMKWAGPRGLINPEMKAITVYHDDPSITSIEKVRQDACITINSDVKVEGEVGRSVIKGGKYAVGHFEIKMSDTNGFEKAWNTMCNWFTGSGYQPGDGDHYELYYNHTSQHPEGMFILDICIPVKPL